MSRKPDDDDNEGFTERMGEIFAAQLQPAPLSLSSLLGTGSEDDNDSEPEAAKPEAAAPPPVKTKRRVDRDHQQGHRARLRERFITAGPASVADYEMLELVLFRAIPRRDVKPLAKRLIEEFSDFNGVISAPIPRLNAVSGIGPAVVLELKIIEAAAHRLARAKVMHRNALSSWTALMAYCKTSMAHRETEQFRILFLDRKNVLIADEEQAKGTVDHVPVYPREVVKRALELNASALILVHNHPSGDPTPSKADIDMTRQIERAAKAVGITVHDHVIVGKEEDVSFRGTGLL
ncbi:MAG: DNA repair protein RadC [Pseudomonadota bacterium]